MQQKDKDKKLAHALITYPWMLVTPTQTWCVWTQIDLDSSYIDAAALFSTYYTGVCSFCISLYSSICCCPCLFIWWCQHHHWNLYNLLSVITHTPLTFSPLPLLNTLLSCCFRKVIISNPSITTEMLLISLCKFVLEAVSKTFPSCQEKTSAVGQLAFLFVCFCRMKQNRERTWSSLLVCCRWVQVPMRRLEPTVFWIHDSVWPSCSFVDLPQWEIWVSLWTWSHPCLL